MWRAAARSRTLESLPEGAMQETEVPLSSPAGRAPAASLIPLYCGEFCLFVANSIAFTAIATRAIASGLDSTVIGVAGSAYYAGLFAIYLAGPVVIRHAGLRPMILAAA